MESLRKILIIENLTKKKNENWQAMAPILLGALKFFTKLKTKKKLCQCILNVPFLNPFFIFTQNKRAATDRDVNSLNIMPSSLSICICYLFHFKFTSRATTSMQQVRPTICLYLYILPHAVCTVPG